MRSRSEVEAQRESFRRQALAYRRAQDGPEALLCAVIVGVLAWVLGETSAPTVRVKLD